MDGAELHLHSRTGHLVVDGSLDSYDAPAAELVLQRSPAFLDRLRRSPPPLVNVRA